MQAHDVAFNRAIAGRGFGPGAQRPKLAVAGQVAAEQPAVPPEVRRANAIEIGRADDTGNPVDLDLVRLIEGRLLIQGLSGAGKSWTLRRLLEQTAGKIPQIVVDPEGEFCSLAERFGHVVIEGNKLDTATLAIAARRAREHRLSILLDLSDLPREQQVIYATAFFEALVEAPREHWHPALVAVDEAHLFAPFGGHSIASASVRKAAVGAVTDLMSRGRKRGLVGLLATPRLARLSKSVVSECHNFLIGHNTLDLDIKRAAETIGWDTRRAFDRLPMLEAGDFVCVGAAFSRSPAVLRVGSIETFHRGSAPALAAPAAMDAEGASALLGLDALIEASVQDEETRAEDPLVPGLRAVRAFIRDASFPLAGRIWGELLPLRPNGAAVSQIADLLDASHGDVAAALELLDRHGAVEFSGEGVGRAVRVGKGMAS